MAKMTVDGVLCDINEPYKEGHTLTAGEADALNQTFKENVRNNVVGAKERIEKKENRKVSDQELQEMVADYANDYEFGVRGGGARDPVETEAMELAREQVRKTISRRPDLTLKNFSAAKISELARDYLSGPAGPALRQRASALVEARQRIASEADLAEPDIGPIPSGGNGQGATA